METHRPRRRRSRRRTKKKHVALLVVLALAAGAFVWTRILVERHRDATMFTMADAPTTNATGASPRIAAPTGPSLAASGAATRNLILFVGTGFGIAPMTATRIYAVGEDGQLAIDRLTDMALVRTASRNAQGADGAAAMTAYMTGVRVDNEVLSQSADTRPYDEGGRPQATRGETTCASVGNGKRVPTLLELAKGSGRATGIVTTARVTQAITAATYAHLCQRDGENSIANQLVPGGPEGNTRLGDGLDVIFGGGWQGFVPKGDPRGSTRNDGRDLYAEMRARGYAVVGRQSELAGTTQATGKVLGLFAPSQMRFDLDRPGSGEPSLAEMTARAIDLLQKNANGYLLVVEGGRIGDALDASLARKALQDGRAFDDAVSVALDRVRASDPELRSTTIVVTADHDHTLVLNGDSTIVERTSEGRPGVLGVLRPYDAPTRAATDATGRPYPVVVFGAGERRTRGPRSQGPALSDLAFVDRAVRHEAAVELSGAIGGTDVPLAAIGAQAARFRGTLDNTQVFALMREAMGL